MVRPTVEARDQAADHQCYRNDCNGHDSQTCGACRDLRWRCDRDRGGAATDRAPRVEGKIMIMRVLPMLIVVAFVGIGALSALIVDADKRRRERANSERRNQQWRSL